MSDAFDRQRVIDAAGHVVVLLGGTSVEREISLLSGAAVYESLLRTGIRATCLDVGEQVVSELTALAPDFALNMLHGEGGEDGVIQGFLELLAVPYSGSGVLASALAMDKIRAKQVWLQQGLATPDFELLTKDSDWEAVATRLGTCVVKPVSGGSSLGIAKAHDADAIYKAYAAALEVGARVMAETCIDGPEYTVGVLEDTLLPTIELGTRGQLYDFEAKYLSHETTMICPANLNGSDAAQLDTLARQAYDALGCEGTARVDVMRDAAGQFLLLEMNTLPGMTDHSFVPRAAAQAGIDFDELVLRIVDQGLRGRRQ